MAPQVVEDCVTSMMADKNFKGTKSDAYAICTAQYNKKMKGVEKMGEPRELDKKQVEVEREEPKPKSPYEKVIFKDGDEE